MINYDDDLVKFPPGKKDKKKWCGGHVGRLHQYEWVRDKFTLNKFYDNNPTYVFTCQVCGRISDYCFNWRKDVCKCGKHNNGI